MNTFMKSFMVATMSLMAFPSIAAVEDICGEYTATRMITLDLGPFGSEGAEDWQIVDLSGHKVTLITEGHNVTFKNFFPFEGGDLQGEYIPESNAVVFQPQTVMGDYTFCAYPTGDWWMDNKLIGEPQPLEGSFNDEGVFELDMWSVVKGVDVMATNYYSSLLEPSSYSTPIKDICGEYTATRMITLDLGPFGSEGAEDWQIVDLSDHKVTLIAEDHNVTFKNFFPFEGGDLQGEYIPESNAVVFQPQTVMGDYTFCAYPTGDWWMDNKLIGEPQPLEGKFNDEGVFEIDMWSVVKGVDVMATCYYSSILTPDAENSIETISATNHMALEGVYDLMGRQIRKDNDIQGLPTGIYVVGRKKIVVR